MPGNARELVPGWAERAMIAVDHYLSPPPVQTDFVGSMVALAAEEHTEEEAPAPRRRRTSLELKEHRLVLENDLAGFYPSPELARKRIEKQFRKLGFSRVMELLSSNPATFAPPHERRLRWVSQTLSENLRKLEELLP
jgi:hypothetical protein